MQKVKTILKVWNKYRVQNGLQPVELDETLSGYLLQQFEHMEGRFGDTPFSADRISNAVHYYRLVDASGSEVYNAGPTNFMFDQNLSSGKADVKAAQLFIADAGHGYWMDWGKLGELLKGQDAEKVGIAIFRGKKYDILGIYCGRLSFPEGLMTPNDKGIGLNYIPGWNDPIGTNVDYSSLIRWFVTIDGRNIVKENPGDTMIQVFQGDDDEPLEGIICTHNPEHIKRYSLNPGLMNSNSVGAVLDRPWDKDTLYRVKGKSTLRVGDATKVVEKEASFTTGKKPIYTPR